MKKEVTFTSLSNNYYFKTEHLRSTNSSLKNKVYDFAVDFFKIIDCIRLMTFCSLRDKICNSQTIWIKEDGTKISGAWEIAKNHYKNDPFLTPPSKNKKIIIESEQQINGTLITLPYLEVSRLGDYSKFYWNAKVLASKLGVPVALRSFPNSELFKVSERAPYQLGSSLQSNNFTQLTAQQAQDIYDGKLTAAQLGKGIFSAPYFWNWQSRMTLPENSKDKEAFIQDFKPIKEVKIVEPVAGKINIAIQVREGGSFDHLTDKFLYPERFPDISYYQAQLRSILNLPEHQGKDVHVHLFTDAIHPQPIIKQLEEIAKECSPNVTFACRPPGESNEDATLSDMISLSKFPIVIRAVSGFSDLSMTLGQPKIEIMPSDFELDTKSKSVSITQVRKIQRSADKEIVTLENQRFIKAWPGKNSEFKEFATIFKKFFPPRIKA